MNTHRRQFCEKLKDHRVTFVDATPVTMRDLLLFADMLDQRQDDAKRRDELPRMTLLNKVGLEVYAELCAAIDAANLPCCNGLDPYEAVVAMISRIRELEKEVELHKDAGLK